MLIEIKKMPLIFKTIWHRTNLSFFVINFEQTVKIKCTLSQGEHWREPGPNSEYKGKARTLQRKAAKGEMGTP